MKRACIIAGVMCASVVLIALCGLAVAEKWRRAPVDPRYPHITATSQ